MQKWPLASLQNNVVHTQSSWKPVIIPIYSTSQGLWTDFLFEFDSPPQVSQTALSGLYSLCFADMGTAIRSDGLRIEAQTWDLETVTSNVQNWSPFTPPCGGLNQASRQLRGDYYDIS